ncbi:PEP-CTERM-box response regulator transcription factor [Gynuella sunshinyii]|uniref:Response regulator containing CheY-like receiver, AAA-type ATPase, and DNA-binding domain n=1 Tax=Gynuella sunshinyii YC6258 TaxID=1445510 RepID=A0A0C5VHJ9_9GAMM|nr:PEP-CTERM-box response regulator transcription factor [Gynuella sunshinyii]AJQ92803.1 response regulator containing CheY-like receiver, AAA-type ATPase, and DNA-binding domain [Gynuella sunshinyii YC6258]
MSEARYLLIVEDDAGLQSQFKWSFEDYSVLIAANRTDAVNMVRQYEPKVVLQDLGLPPDEDGVSEGMLCIADILSIYPETKIIVLTGKNQHENAIRAIGNGAYDFYNKPIDIDTLNFVVDRAYKIYGLEQKNRSLLNDMSYGMDGVITSDPEMLRVCRMAERIAPSDVTCTILGESGTGKEVMARAIHNKSDRADKRFVAINCAAVPENLMESELFGYEKGAFTGAVKQTEGKFESANKGTLFLDEIGDMPLSLQAKLLRFLQERVIERVGGRREIPINVRIICATNKNLDEMVKEGTFREDLFYRITEMVLHLPRLSERDADKALLARYFLNRYVTANNLNVNGFTEDAIHAINNYDWPGNIRELENKIKRAVIMAEGKQVTADDLGLRINGTKSLILKDVRMRAERSAILEALSLTNGNVSSAAKLLGVTRPTLYDLSKKYEISF